MRNLEYEMLSADKAELIASNEELRRQIVSAIEKIAELSSLSEEYKDKYKKVLNIPGALEEYRQQEAEKYKHHALAKICSHLSRTFYNGPFVGVDVELQYPPFADGKPLGNWKGHGEIMSVSFKNANGDILHWSQSNGTLDSQGNHITQNDGIFNINTGEYQESAKKIVQVRSE